MIEIAKSVQTIPLSLEKYSLSIDNALYGSVGEYCTQHVI